MTMEDIAKTAGVSKAAVSLALNNRPGVSRATKERIKAVVAELGYVHRKRSQAHLSDSAQQTIRFLSLSGDPIMNAFSTSPFYLRILEELERLAYDYGSRLVFSTIQRSDYRTQMERIIEESRSQRLIILATSLSRDDVAVVPNDAGPLVILDGSFDTAQHSCIAINNAQGAYLAANLLLDHGHTSIGIIESSDYSHNFTERKTAFEQTLVDHGHALRPEHIYTCQTAVSLSAEELYQQLKLESNLPTAFFCENDTLATSLMSAIKRMRLRVPEDVSIVGFDDLPIATQVQPALTSVKVDVPALAEMALVELDRQSRHPGCFKTKIRVDTSLIVRESVVASDR